MQKFKHKHAKQINYFNRLFVVPIFGSFLLPLPLHFKFSFFQLYHVLLWLKTWCYEKSSVWRKNVFTMISCFTKQNFITLWLRKVNFSILKFNCGGKVERSPNFEANNKIFQDGVAFIPDHLYIQSFKYSKWFWCIEFKIEKKISASLFRVKKKWRNIYSWGVFCQTNFDFQTINNEYNF